ncbi:general odorant-binding protein 56d-like [Ochlerotatus camptorhynchus]|uniref:general odorant-binding protein 56d-like n=1 Tax=Ochlerotatus camptorhynchus TaxID=644619 RepID=UPI0031DC69EE
MKPSVLIALVVCLGVAIATPQQPNLEDIGKIRNGESYALECLLSSGLDISSLKSLQTGDFSTSGNSAKCLVKCFFEKTGFMDAEGNLNEEAIVKQLSLFMPKDQVDTLVKNCNLEGTDPCDTAYQATECYFKNKAGLF